MTQPRFFLVADDGTVSWTNDFEIATACMRDGATVVIEPAAMEHTFDGDTQTIEETDPDDFIDEDDDEGDD